MYGKLLIDCFTARIIVAGIMRSLVPSTGGGKGREGVGGERAGVGRVGWVCVCVWGGGMYVKERVGGEKERIVKKCRNNSVIYNMLALIKMQ